MFTFVICLHAYKNMAEYGKHIGSLEYPDELALSLNIYMLDFVDVEKM